MDIIDLSLYAPDRKMGSVMSAEENSQNGAVDFCTPAKVTRKKNAPNSRRRSSTEVLYLTDIAEQRGYSRVVHGNSGAAFMSAMHGF